MSFQSVDAIFDGIGDAVIYVDDSLVCSYANAAARGLSGRPQIEEGGVPLGDLLPPPLHATLESHVSESLLTRTSKSFRVLDPSSESWFFCRIATPAEGLIIFLHKIDSAASESESAAIDDVMKMSRQQFMALADATPQIVWTIAPTGAVSYLNHPGREYFGVEEKARSFGWTRHIHPDDVSVMHDRWRNALVSGGMFEAELRLRRYDGEFRWHLARALPTRDNAGKITHWCGTSTDIHELVCARKQLEEREALFRTLADAAPVMIWMTNAEREFTYVNRRWLDFTGRTLESELANDWTRDIHPEDLNECVTSVSKAYDALSPFRMEFRLRSRDGTYRWVLDHGSPLVNATGEFSGYIGSCIDIEDRRRQEEQARAIARLEYRNRELQDFAYVASHDLQEPLRKILSFANLLKADDSAGDEEKQRYLSRIEESADRMRDLIRDLLAYSRVATQREAFRVLELRDVVRDALIDLELRISETDGTVEIGPLCEIEADPVQMHQLFQNLIANALKFHREGVPPVVSLTARTTDSYCEIEVRDNGIGFDPEEAERVFAPFQRLHGRTYQGSGMGLAICRRIVERHNGTITATSAPNQGSIFTIRLPLARPTSAESS